MAASVSGPCHAVAQFDDSRIYGQDLRQEPGRYRGQLGRGLLRNLLTSLLLPTLDPHGKSTESLIRHLLKKKQME